MHWLLTLLVAGFVSGGIGIYLLGFTDYLDTAGFAGIAVVVGLLTAGLFLIVPAKIYIILRFTRSARAGNATKQPAAQRKSVN